MTFIFISVIAGHGLHLTIWTSWQCVALHTDDFTGRTGCYRQLCQTAVVQRPDFSWVKTCSSWELKTVFYHFNLQYILHQKSMTKSNTAAILHVIHLWHSAHLTWLSQSSELPQGLSLSISHRKPDILNFTFLDHVRKIRKKSRGKWEITNSFLSLRRQLMDAWGDLLHQCIIIFE